MPEQLPSDPSFKRLRLTYQGGLISVGLIAFPAVFPWDGPISLIALASGCGFIASAFTRFPNLLALRVRKGYGHRLAVENAAALGTPLLMGAFSLYMSWSTAQQLSFPYWEPKWYEHAEYWIQGVILLINVLVLAANLDSLIRERLGPR